MKKSEILKNTAKKAAIGTLAAVTAFCFMMPAVTSQTYAKTRHVVKPGVISKVKFKDQSNGCTVITWKNASRAKKYKVYFKVDNASGWDTATETKNDPSEVVRTGYDHTLHIKVKAYNGKTAGKMSKTYSFHTKPLDDYAVGTPSTLTLKVGETKNITYKTVKGWNREDPLFDYAPGSNAENIATVSEDGTVTGLSEGSFMVYNRASSKTPKVKIIVTGGNSGDNNNSDNKSNDSASDSGKSSSGNTSGNSGSNSGSSAVTPSTPSTPTTPMDSTDAKLKAKVQEIKAEMGITDSMSDLMKAKLVAEWECRYFSYDQGIYSDPNYYPDTDPKITLLSDDPSTVCAGYAEAYTYILTQIGVPAKNIIYFSGNHEWTLVKINGKWYNVDVTWMDDNGGQRNSTHINWTEFMMSYSKMIANDKFWTKSPHEYYKET
ncbi:MAG: transglutaminase domain-containing protein, partial [Eubacterium sp.]